MTLDDKLRWKAHVKKKTRTAWTKIQQNVMAHGKKIGPVDTQLPDRPCRYTISWSALSIHNKVTLYKLILKPAWTCGIQLWGCTKQSNNDIIQRFQNKVLRNIVHAPSYIRNADLHRDLQMEMVTIEIGKFTKKHEEKLLHHVNIEATQLLDKSELVRRLKKNLLSWCSDH